MAKWFKEYLGFGNRRSPPRPPKPDYTESEILRAYRAQKNLDFEDPYEEKECTVEHPRSPARFGAIQETNLVPRKRLIKVEQTENNWSSRSRLGAALEADDITKVTVGNEYSDPFDVTNKGNLENNEVENASYMEPYENQGSFTGIESPTRNKLDKGLQLYDSPYEERYQGFFQECRQPSDDERPADEYDQPWEWKKEGISRAFAEQFEGSGWQHRSPTSRVLLLQSKPRSPDTPQRKNTSSINLIEKETESSSKDRECALTEPTISSSLFRQEWYHGTMRHEDAERLLSEVNLGSFLLRTENDSFHYISVRGFHSILHIKVAIAQDGRFQLADSGPTFSCILDLIQHYIQSPLLVPGEGHLSLQCPVSSVER